MSLFIQQKKNQINKFNHWHFLILQQALYLIALYKIAEVVSQFLGEILPKGILELIEKLEAHGMEEIF